MMAFCTEHPKWDQNPKFTPLSEMTIIPTTFICGVSPREKKSPKNRSIFQCLGSTSKKVLLISNFWPDLQRDLNSSHRLFSREPWIKTKGANSFLVFSIQSKRNHYLCFFEGFSMQSYLNKYLTVLSIHNFLIESCKMVTECAAVSS